MRRASWAGLPSALVEALAACARALDERPWEHPPGALQAAVRDALGACPTVLHGAAHDEARARRPDLAARLDAEGGVLAAARGIDAGEAVRERVRRLVPLDAREERGASARLELDRDAVVHLPSDAARWPGLRRRGLLAMRSAQSVVPMWMHAHPEDDRPLLLVEDLEDAMAFAPRRRVLRDELERETHAADPALSALRAIILAHDLLTQSDARLETADLPDLCAYAWLDAPPELVPDARSAEPTARAEAFFRWWIEEAVPSAWRAA